MRWEKSFPMENRTVYFDSLQKNLQKLPNTEQEKIIKYYQERFELAVMKGKAEEEVMRAWGDPRKLAKLNTMMYYLRESTQNDSYRWVLRTVLASWGTGYRNWVTTLAPFTLFTLISSVVYLLSFAMMLTPFTALSAYLAGASLAQSILNLFLSLALVGLGMITFVGAHSLTVFFLQRFIWHLRFKIASIRGVTQ